MKTLHVLLISIVTAAITSLFFANTRNAPSTSREAQTIKKTVFEKVMQTQTLRCGYAVANPWFIVNTDTNTFSGVGFDVTNAVANKIGLNVEWVEETGWGVAEQGLQSGRYDMLCGSVCVDPRRTQAAYYSIPFVHIPVFAFVRSNDSRFENTQAFNASNINVGVKNGHVFEFIANENFPRANKVYLGDISDDTEFMLMVEGRKADVSFAGQETIDLYNRANNNSIKAIGKPVRFCNGGFMLPRGENELKHTVDAAISELNASGVLDTIVAKYMPLDDRYIQLPAKQYR